MNTRPLALDLCCGLGGWAAGLLAAGWSVLGVDVCDFASAYPGAFVRADLLTWEAWRELPVRLVVASPPCQEFSRHSMPWLLKKKPPAPDLRLWRRAELIAGALGVPLVIENVRGAQRFMGRSVNFTGPFHFWGDGVPAIMPGVCASKASDRRNKSTRAATCARLPFQVAFHVGRVHLCERSPVAPATF